MGVTINSTGLFLDKRKKDLEEIRKKIHNNEMRFQVTEPIDEMRRIDLENQVFLREQSRLEMEIRELTYAMCSHVLWQDKFNPDDIRCPECEFSTLAAAQLITPEALQREYSKIYSSFIFSSDIYGNYRDFCLMFKDIKVYFPESSPEELVDILKTKRDPEEKYIQRLLEHKRATGTVMNFRE
jgi:hypothetical protein